ncbi:hypothetical protein Gorai_006278, partial [Gossypium raimondii]|nr:hypothetical protein [Gossypium raimondii]
MDDAEKGRGGEGELSLELEKEKFGGRHWPKVSMDNFRDVMVDLVLIDVKPDK